MRTTKPTNRLTLAASMLVVCIVLLSLSCNANIGSGTGNNVGGASDLPAGAKSISTQSTASTFTAKYTTPTLSEIMQEASNRGASYTNYMESEQGIYYREATDNEAIPTQVLFYNGATTHESTTFIASDTATERTHTVSDLQPARYFYTVSISHKFEGSNQFTVFDERIYEARLLQSGTGTGGGTVSSEVETVEIKERTYIGNNITGGIKNISTVRTTAGYTVVQYTTPTLSETKQLARNNGATNPAYYSHGIGVHYREATNTEPIPTLTSFYDDTVKTAFFMADGAYNPSLIPLDTTPTIKRNAITELKPNTRYFYVMYISVSFLNSNIEGGSNYTAISRQVYEARTNEDLPPANIRDISTQSTTSESFTVQYTTPTPSGIIQEASDRGTTNPVYRSSYIRIIYKEASDTEAIPTLIELSSPYIYPYKTTTFIASDTATERTYTVDSLEPNTRYFYRLEVLHYFDNPYHAFYTYDTQIYETRTNEAPTPTDISTQSTTSESFTVQYTTPTLSEITQEATDRGATSPVYSNSRIYIYYREATDTEPPPTLSQLSYPYKSTTFIATDTATERTYTVDSLEPNTRYFYRVSARHEFDENDNNFTVKDTQVYETRTLP